MTAGYSQFRTIEGPIVPNLVTWATLAVDIEETFMTAAHPELAVEGAHEIVIPGRELNRKFAPDRRYILRDLHAIGSVSLCSSFVGYVQFYKLRYAEVKHWTEENNRIAPHALFTLQELKRYLKKVKGRFQTLWPDHAIEGTDRARVDAILELEGTITWYKGNRPHADSNSGFEENDGHDTGLYAQLSCRKVRTIVVWGIAGDVCAGLTALHGRLRGLEVYFVVDLSPSISVEGRDAMYAQLKTAGVHLVTSDQIQTAA